MGVQKGGTFHGGRPRGASATFFADRRGTIAVMTALLLPVLIILIGVTFDVGRLMAQVAVADSIAEASCQRSIKPTRTMTPTDSARRANVLKLFDQMIGAEGLTVRSRTATIDWITTNLRAELRYSTMFSEIVGVKVFDYEVEQTCSGIPPYPRDGEIVLDTNFVQPNGGAILPANSCWNVFRFDQFGWDAGTGPGIEIQDWTAPGRCFGARPAAQFPSPYVVELDSHGGPPGFNNSSITKIIELHPGDYEFSVWYNGRITDINSNGIGIYLQKTRPVTEVERRIIYMARSVSEGWKRFCFPIRVSQYSIYRLTIKAEGIDDTVGGLFNSFNVQYIDSVVPGSLSPTACRPT